MPCVLCDVCYVFGMFGVRSLLFSVWCVLFDV